MNDEESIARLNVENGREGRVPRKYKLMLLIAADNFFPMRVIYYFFIAFLFGICSQTRIDFYFSLFNNKHFAIQMGWHDAGNRFPFAQVFGRPKHKPNIPHMFWPKPSVAQIAGKG